MQRGSIRMRKWSLKTVKLNHSNHASWLKDCFFAQFSVLCSWVSLPLLPPPWILLLESSFTFWLPRAEARPPVSLYAPHKCPIHSLSGLWTPATAGGPTCQAAPMLGTSSTCLLHGFVRRTPKCCAPNALPTPEHSSKTTWSMFYHTEELVPHGSHHSFGPSYSREICYGFVFRLEIFQHEFFSKIFLKFTFYWSIHSEIYTNHKHVLE